MLRMMKSPGLKLIVLCCLVLAAASSAAGAGARSSGGDTWSGQWYWTTETQTVFLTQSGSTVSGHFNLGDGPATLSCKVSGPTCSGAYDEDHFTVTFAITIRGKTFTGNWEATNKATGAKNGGPFNATCTAGPCLQNSAQAPDATLLVLQPADTAGTRWQSQTSPKLDGGADKSASSSFQAPGLIGGLPGFMTSRAVVYRDATDAHAAFLAGGGSQGSAAQVGQESRRTGGANFGRDYQQETVVWRHGNVVAQIDIRENPVSLKTDIAILPQRQQARIAALVAPANPGPPRPPIVVAPANPGPPRPPIVVKPVIHNPVAMPAQPRAGGRFTLTYRVTQSTDGASLTGGSLTSTVFVGNLRIAHQYSFSRGQLRIAMTVPKTATGRALKITATIRAEQATTKTVSYRVQATAIRAASSAAAATAGKPLPCSNYIPQMGVNAITHPPTWKCALSINSQWLQCLIATNDRGGVVNALTCFKLRSATKYTLIYATGVSRRTKRNALIDFKGMLEGYCSVDNPSICSDVRDVEREIRKLS